MRRQTVWLLLTVFILSACRLNAAPLEPVPTLEPEAEATAPALPGDEVLQPGDYELTVVNNQDRRTVLLHLPPAYDGQSQLPLVIVLHGGGGSARQVRLSTGMDTDADEYGFVVAYPNGSGRLDDMLLTWNAGHCCGYALENGVDDVGILRVLIDSLLSHYAIDPQRVYITGMSNGAMMAHRAGAELADKVAAIAPVAGSLGGQLNADGPPVAPAKPSSPVAVIAFHGLEDQHVLYAGGPSPMAVLDGRIDFSTAISIGFWVSANGCDLQPAAGTLDDGDVVMAIYSGCNGGANVALVSIANGGHAWPGGRRGLMGDAPPQDVSANRMMLEFFLQHPKQ